MKKSTRNSYGYQDNRIITLGDIDEENARLAVADAVDRWLPFIELTDFQITK